MNEEEQAQQKQVVELAAESGLADKGFLDIYYRVCKALATEFGATAFSGVGQGFADVGFDVGDVQYKIVLTEYKSLKAPQ